MTSRCRRWVARVELQPLAVGAIALILGGCPPAPPGGFAEAGDHNLDVQDTMNNFGDEAIAQVLIDDLSLDAEWYDRLDDPLDIEDVGHDGEITYDLTKLKASAAGYRESGELMKYVTGRLALLPVTMQDEFWGELNKKYVELVEYYKLTGEYNLESQALNLEAEIINKDLLASINTDVSGFSALSGPAYLEHIRSKNLTKPFKQEELEEKLTKVIGPYREQVATKLAETQAEYKTAKDAYKKTEEDVWAITAELDRLQTRKATLPTQIIELNRRLVDINAELARMRSEEDIKLDIDAFGQMAESTEDATKKELFQLKSDRAREELEKRRLKEGEVEGTRKAITENQTELDALEPKINEVYTKQNQARTQRRALGQEVDRLEDLVKKLEKPYAAGEFYAEELGKQVKEDYDRWLEYMTSPRPDPNNEGEMLPPMWRVNVEDRTHNAEQGLNNTLSVLKGRFVVGRSFQIPVGSSGESMKAVLYKITYKPGKRYNPASPQNFTLHFALNNPKQQMPIYLDKVGEWHIELAREEYVPTWDSITPQELTEERYMVTGNLLLTPDALLEPQTNRIGRGTMTFFTRKDGTTEAGIFLPRGYTPDMVDKIPVGLNPEQVLPALLHRSTGSLRYEPKDVSLSLSRGYYGNVVYLNIPGTKDAAAPFLHNTELVELLEDKKFRAGSWRRKKQYSGRIKEENVVAAIKMLYETHEVRFTVGRKLYNDIFGQQQQQGQQGPGGFANAPRATLKEAPGWKMNIGRMEQTKTAKDFRSLMEGEINAAHGSVKAWRAVLEETAKSIEANNPDSKIAKELRTLQRIELTGKQVDYRDAARSLAELWQVYRNPKMEILHQVYTDQNGIILAHHAMTLGLSSTVGPKNIFKYVYEVKKRIAKFEEYTGGPVQVHFIHNHPAGDSTLSLADKDFATALRWGTKGHFALKGETKVFQEGLGDKFGQFVVIDHNNFSYINPYGYSSGRVIMDEKQAEYRPDTADHIRNIQELSQFGHFLNYAKDKIMLVFTHADLRVTYFAPYSKNLLQKKPRGCH